MDVGNSSGLSADLNVQSSRCPCCSSARYIASFIYDDNGIAVEKATTCLDCRDRFCKRCSNGD